MKNYSFIILITLLAFPLRNYSQTKNNSEYVQLINKELSFNNPGRSQNRAYDVKLSNGYFYSVKFYEGRKIGESRIHIEDINSINYEEGMGELYLKLKCKNSKNCSLWTDHGEDIVFDFMYLRVMDSRSGDKIKDLIGKIVYNETGHNINNSVADVAYANKVIDNSRKVYYCDSKSSYAYHSSLSCDGLANCEYQVYEIGENSVRNLGYRYCQICWE